MAYATEADLNAAWGTGLVDLLTVDEITLQRDDARINSNLEGAEAIVNSYVARRYQLPAQLTPDGAILLRRCTVDLAIHQLAVTADRMTDIIQKRHDAAMALLRDIAGGKADVAVAPGGGGHDPVSPNEAVIVGPERTFTRDSMRDF